MWKIRDVYTAREPGSRRPVWLIVSVTAAELGARRLPTAVPGDVREPWILRTIVLHLAQIHFAYFAKGGLVAHFSPRLTAMTSTGISSASVAKEWADPSVSIPGYHILPGNIAPRKGDVVLDAITSESTSSCRTAAMERFSASSDAQKVVHNPWGFRQGQAVVIRRCNCDGP
jgi:hypothetical protein